MSSVSFPEHFFRHEYGRIVSVLSRRVGLGNIEMIEDAVQSALATALEKWKTSSLPDNPSAWLYKVASNRLIDDLRRDTRHQDILKRHSETHFTTVSLLNASLSDEEIVDDLLKMLFFCCDPSIPVESQLVIALKTLCGFDVSEIAYRLFTSKDNVYKRLTRARSQLKIKRLDSEDLSPSEYTDRLEGVLQVLYLLFTEGYLSTHVDYSIRIELCQEAMRLAELLADSSIGSTPVTEALLALMYMHYARSSARIDGSGGLVLLEDQDRSLWDQKDIQTGMGWLKKSARGDIYSRYHSEAAIAAAHCLSSSYGETDWEAIVRHYDLLISVAPSAVHELNRAIALAESKGPEKALAVLKKMLPPSWLVTSYLWSAVLADLHFRNGSTDLGNQYVKKAYEYAPTDSIRKLLSNRFNKYYRTNRNGSK